MISTLRSKTRAALDARLLLRIMTATTDNDDIFSARQPKCYFLALPPELRNDIYKQVLTSNKPVTVQRHDVRYRRHYYRINMPPLLQTCRKIRAEATSLFFANNVFHFEITNTLPFDHFHFDRLAAQLQYLKRFAIKMPGLLYTVDIANGLYSRKVASEHAGDERCLYTFAFSPTEHEKVCQSLCRKGCRKLRAIIDAAAAEMGDEGSLRVEDMEKMMRVSF